MKRAKGPSFVICSSWRDDWKCTSMSGICVECQAVATSPQLSATVGTGPAPKSTCCVACRAGAQMRPPRRTRAAAMPSMLVLAVPRDNVPCARSAS